MTRPLPFARAGIHPAIAAAVAFVASATLGLLDLPPLLSLPFIAARLGFDAAPAISLSLACAIGLLGWHVATLTVPPRPAVALPSIAAALLPVLLMPGVGLAALLPAMALSFMLRRQDRRQRIVALLVQCGAVLAIAAHISPVAAIAGDCFLFAMMALACGFALFGSAVRAANDNPLLKRESRTGWFYESGRDVSFMSVQSGPMID